MTEFTEIFGWARNNGTVLWTVSIVSLVTFVGTLAAIPFFVARIPEDYLIRKEGTSRYYYVSHPALHHIFLIVKNLLGIIFILAGAVMVFIPGQGIITMLIGVMLMDFPGKRRLALGIVKQQKVLKTLNWIRARSQKQPLQLP